MTLLLILAAALVLGGPVLRGRPLGRPPLRLVLVVVLVEIRSGRSVLAALQAVARLLPDEPSLVRVARVATVAGLSAAVSYADERVRPIVSQLARAQRSGAPLAGTVRRLIEDNLAEERTTRLARARALPTRLMVPVTLLMLPGMIVLLYAPSLFALHSELVVGLP